MIAWFGDGRFERMLQQLKIGKQEIGLETESTAWEWKIGLHGLGIEDWVARFGNRRLGIMVWEWKIEKHGLGMEDWIEKNGFGMEDWGAWFGNGRLRSMVWEWKIEKHG